MQLPAASAPSKCRVQGLRRVSLGGCLPGGGLWAQKEQLPVASFPPSRASVGSFAPPFVKQKVGTAGRLVARCGLLVGASQYDSSAQDCQRCRGGYRPTPERVSIISQARCRKLAVLSPVCL